MTILQKEVARVHDTWYCNLIWEQIDTSSNNVIIGRLNPGEFLIIRELKMWMYREDYGSPGVLNIFPWIQMGPNNVSGNIKLAPLVLSSELSDFGISGEAQYADAYGIDPSAVGNHRDGLPSGALNVLLRAGAAADLNMRFTVNSGTFDVANYMDVYIHMAMRIDYPGSYAGAAHQM